MKPKTMILMIVAVACGLGASYMTSRLLAERNQRPAEEKKVPVLYAKQTVAAWVQIQDPEAVFEVREVNESAVPKKALSDHAQLKDKRLNKVIEATKPVTEDDLLSAEQEGLVAKMKPGQRAITIRVTIEQNAHGYVMPGTLVDILSVMRGNDPHSKWILEKMVVLAADANHTRDPNQPNQISQTVTLAASPEEALRLSLAQSIGELRLAIRRPDDNLPLRIGRVTAGDLDKPSKSGIRKEREDETPGATPVVSLPPVVPEAPKVETKPEVKPEAKPEAKPEVKPPVVVKRRPRRHIMQLNTGPNTERVIFLLDLDEDDDDSPSSSAPSAPRPIIKPIPTLKPIPKVDATPTPTPTPPPAFDGGGTRKRGSR
jgi:pilus assembly protein CpaB